jgi:hypothetical protein
MAVNRRVGNRAAEAEARNRPSTLFARRGQFAEAVDLRRHALELACEIDERAVAQAQ